jgi:subtilase family serine protease
LPNHAPAIAKWLNLQPKARLSANAELHLAIGLPLRNREALATLLADLYDPASPQYRHYLTPEQFAKSFGPTEQDYEAVVAFAEAHNLRVTERHPNRVLLDVSGSVADIERTFQVNLLVYPHPGEAREFYAPDVKPSLAASLPVLSVSGLDNYSIPHPRIRDAAPIENLSRSYPLLGSGPSGTYMGKDFRQAYAPNVTLTGSKQVVGLVEFDGFYNKDITTYLRLTGLPKTRIKTVLLDNFNGAPGYGNIEVALDIDMAMSMAPGLTQIIVYEAGPYGNWYDMLNRMATDNAASQLSCSWYSPGAGPDPVADQIFQQMAAQGQSFYNASGDYDAYTGLISFPGDNPHITQVGGTTLSMTANGGAYVSETVWNWDNGIGSGGGISTSYALPAWQANINFTLSGGSRVWRNVPDVALIADNVFVVADNGVYYQVGGTSCAAPLWAGFTALVNQQALASKKPVVGFLNPTIYSLGAGAVYSSAIHDITTGDNTSSSSPTQFFAVAGYDLCTGWGTPNGQALITALLP